MIFENLPEIGRFLLHGETHGDVPAGIVVVTSTHECDCCGPYTEVTYLHEGEVVASAETHFGTFRRTYSGAKLLRHMFRETERQLALESM